MRLRFAEPQVEGLELSCEVRAVLHSETTPYQQLAVLDTVTYGRMLVLNGAIQTTIVDEFTYHELIAHVPLCAHPDPQRLLIIGGGDGGAVREALKHPSVQRVDLVEIDGRVVEASRRFLPELAAGLDDPRVNVLVADGIAHVQGHQGAYDVIIVDSTDPVGPAIGLFSPEFYAAVRRALTAEGILVAQTESPFFNRSLIARAYGAVSSIFPRSGLYWGVVPTYPSGMWTFTAGSLAHDPSRPQAGRAASLKGKTKYYTEAVHQAAFALPPFVRELLEGPC